MYQSPHEISTVTVFCDLGKHNMMVCYAAVTEALVSGRKSWKRKVLAHESPVLPMEEEIISQCSLSEWKISREKANNICSVP